MSSTKLRFTAPVVVTISLLAACGGADGPTGNPPAPDSLVHGNPPGPDADAEEKPHANPPGHPDVAHDNPPGPGAETPDADEPEAEKPPVVNKNPPAPAPEKQ